MQSWNVVAHQSYRKSEFQSPASICYSKREFPCAPCTLVQGAVLCLSMAEKQDIVLMLILIPP